jgi:lysozyme family protein
MAIFEPAFDQMLKNEGGYVLHDVAGDRGGMTYAGIARNMNADWAGWELIDRKEFSSELTAMVRDFYRDAYWRPIRGDDLPQEIAESIFDFGVNSGTRTAVKLAQLVVGSQPDGVLGPKTVEALAAMDGDSFKKSYALAKVARYAAICNRNRTQSKFLLGWINRTLKSL